MRDACDAISAARFGKRRRPARRGGGIHARTPHAHVYAHARRAGARACDGRASSRCVHARSCGTGGFL
ncbi:hypothetical protein WT08_12720 [Burkholderia sp. MSMB1552]|nr:hypothetical protein WT08_12720 [Burkholderia sp. MSMB1552]KWZ50703.1 hypothetical protein WS92_25395 [Burkholderia sp. MSMB1588]